jgi:hypothetical protein
MRTRRPGFRLGAAVPLPILLFTLACGGRQTVASKSAASYDEARRKETPVDGGGHGPSPESGSAATGTPHADHSPAPPAAPGGTAHAEHDKPAAANEHAAHGAGRSSAATSHSMSHDDRSGTTPGSARQTAATGGHAAHGTRTGETRTAAGASHAGHSMNAPGQAAGTDHGRMGHAPGAAADHSAMGHGEGMAMPAPKPEPPSSTAAPNGPAASLRTNSLDAPAATAVAEAARSAALTAEMATGGHGMQHGTYVQTDAGRDGAAPAAGPGAAHGGHQGSPGPRATPADPHRTHGAPVATPPTAKPGAVAPSPTGSQHEHGRPAPQARPSPSPKPTPTPVPSPRKDDHR